jgi:hypothetical protein
MDNPATKAGFGAFQPIFSFDFRTQLEGITLYGKTRAPEDMVFIVYANFDPDRRMALAKAAMDYHRTHHNTHIIHDWIDAKKMGKKGAKRVYAAFSGNRAIVGEREERVAAALDVLDGKAPNLGSDNVFPGLGVVGNAHFLEGEARKTADADSDPNAAIFKLSKSVQLVLGESKQQLQGAMTVVTDSDEVAGRTLPVVHGLLAVLKLQNSSPWAVSLAQALVLKQDHSSVIANIALPATEVIELFKADVARRASARAGKKAD